MPVDWRTWTNILTIGDRFQLIPTGMSMIKLLWQASSFCPAYFPLYQMPLV